MNQKTPSTTEAEPVVEKLRHVNDELLVSSVRRERLTEKTEKTFRPNKMCLEESQMLLALELAATQRLQEISTQLIGEDDPNVLYEKILDAAVEIMRSQYASIQLLYPERGNGGELWLMGHRGFSPEAAKFWEWVSPASISTCGVAMSTGERVTVTNIEGDDSMAGSEDLAVYIQAGIHAVQTTPLISRGGKMLGMISTHWHQPHRPADREFRLLDVLARQAADLIERSQAAEALRASEERYRTLFDLGPVAIYSCDASGMIQKFNNRAAELWGRAPAKGDTDERFCGSFKMFRPDGTFMPHDQCPMAEVLSGAIAHLRDGEVHIERPDGSRVVVLVTIRPLKNEHGEITGAINCFYDITDRKRAEEGLGVSEERYRNLFASAPMAVFVCDRDSIIRQYNDRAAILWGREPECGVERHCGSLKLWLPDGTHLPHAQSPIVEVIRTGVPIPNVEVLIERPDGSRLPVLVNFAALKDARGEITGAITSFIDITERKLAEESLSRHRADLENLVMERTAELEMVNNNLKEENAKRLQTEKEHVRLLKQIVTTQEEERRRIARDLHDELGQQLTALRLKLENTKEICGDDVICGEIDDIHAMAARLDQEVSFLARELRPAALEGIGLVQALSAYINEWARMSSIMTEFHVHGLSDTRLAPEIESNLYRIAQEALNNVRKHSKAKNVSVLLEKRRNDITLIVEDDGIAFDPEAKRSRKKGLGLIGMQERAALLGGTIEIESTPGSGSTIFARIPEYQARATGN